MTKIPLALILAEMTDTSIETMSEWGEEEWKELSRQLRKRDKNKSKKDVQKPL